MFSIPSIKTKRRTDAAAASEKPMPDNAGQRPRVMPEVLPPITDTSAQRPRIVPDDAVTPAAPSGMQEPPPQMFSDVPPPEQPASAGSAAIFQSPLEQKRAQLAGVLAQPSEKQNPWAQAAFMGLQALANITSGQNQPIQWLGNAKKQMEVDNLTRDLAPMEAQQQLILRNEAQTADTDMRNAQTAEIRRRPESEREQREAMMQIEGARQAGRIGLEDRRTMNRLEVLNRGADIRAGEAEFYTRDDGTVWKRYKKADSEGKTRSEEQQFDDSGAPLVFRDQAVAPYRDPVSGQTLFAKPKDIITAGQNQQRINETVRSNQANEQYKTQQLSLARERFSAMLAEQRQANEEAAAAAASKDAARQQAAAERAKRLEMQILQIKANWKKNIGVGGFTQEDFNALTGEMDQ